MICEIDGWALVGVQVRVLFGVTVTVRGRIFARLATGCFGGAVWSLFGAVLLEVLVCKGLR